jgi:hypothetical protein
VSAVEEMSKIPHFITSCWKKNGEKWHQVTRPKKKKIKVMLMRCTPTHLQPATLLMVINSKGIIINLNEARIKWKLL